MSGLIAVGERDRMVVLSFPEPTREFAMDAETARQVGEQIARSAYVARFGRQPDGAPRSMVTEGMRQRMRARAGLVARSLAEQGKDWQYIGQHLVDLILKEVA